MRFFFILTLSIIFLSSCRKVNNDCNVSEYPNAPGKDWFTSYGGSGEESHGHFILTCEDGGFLQVGETGFVPNSAKIFVVKTDQNGVLLWKKEFSGGTGHNIGNSAYETDDGYLICGALNENSALIKLNKSDGGLIFEKVHDNGGSDAFEHLTVTQNQIIAVGYAQAEDNANTFFTGGQGYLTFMDLAGNITNQFNITDEMAQAYRIKKLGDDFVISGLTQGASDYKLIKINIDGNVMWSKTFGGSNSDHCFGMDTSADGSIYLTGHTLSGTENWDTYTMKVDGSGNQIWESKQGNPRGFDPKYIHDEAWGIRATSDGGCVVVAGTGDEYASYKGRCGNEGDNSNVWHVYLIKYDAQGNMEWQKTYGDPEGGSWAGEDVSITSNSVVVAVDNGSFGFLKTFPF
ncbi:MAG: hypothetical protein ISP70_04210 [Crocinitomicaceae bacterium]|nr:hypothetical protein [Crocinitomicaceae bacterium]